MLAQDRQLTRRPCYRYREHTVTRPQTRIGQHSLDGRYRGAILVAMIRAACIS
jgi:hypothetical protein